MAFSKLGLSPTTLEGVRAAGYITPTPIQLRGIPLVLAGRDIIGSAQTGTGKTAAFALPILTKLDRHAPVRARSFSNRRANSPRRWKRPSAISRASPI